MILRTEIDIPRHRELDIRHGEGIVMLGSCFTDNIGALLDRDGFDTVHNPMGPLYNPASILNALMICHGQAGLIMRCDDAGNHHCLNFASRYTAASEPTLIESVSAQVADLCAKISHAHTLIITLGTAYVYRLEGGEIVGNCHKFPARDFVRERMSVGQIAQCLHQIVDVLPHNANIIFTVSPIRHTADTLHGNQLSKAALLLALDDIVDHEHVHYFPAYEIMLDDLRDYRFYAADMKHPSPVAVDYIYEKFSEYYFDKPTIEEALKYRKQSLRLAHRQIIE